MNQRRARLSRTESKRQHGSPAFKVDRRRLRNPEIDAEPRGSAIDSLARGLATIGDRLFRGKAMLRIP
jgi:hypothetical protein